MPSLDVILNAWGHGLLLTAAVVVALRFAPRANGATRHALWWATLMLVIVDMAVGWGIGPRGTAVAETLTTGARLAVTAVPAIPVPAVPATLESFLLAGWALVAAVLLFRVATAFRAIQMLKRSTIAFSPERLQRLQYIAPMRRLSGRHARLRTSSMLPGAAVLGGRHPVLVVGAEFADQLADDDLDRVLVHEQSHVERRDDWAALAQACIAALCWCHPAVWFIVRRLDFEREVACDDRVVALTGDARAYATALARVRLLMGGATGAVLAPAASRSSREFLGRVDRLLGAPAVARPSVTWWMCASGCASLACVLVSLHLLPSVFVLSASPLASGDDRSLTAQTLAFVEPASPVSTSQIVESPRAVPPAPVTARPVRPVPVRSATHVLDVPKVDWVSATELPAEGQSPLRAIEPPPRDINIDRLPFEGTFPSADFSLVASLVSGGTSEVLARSAGLPQAHPSGPQAAGVALAQAGKKTAGFFTRVGLAIAKGVSGR